MEKEMNFWDLCLALGRAVARLCCALGRWIASLVRLTYRMWYIVLAVLMLVVAAALYYSRTDNLTYHVRATALLNGPTIKQFEQHYAPLQSGINLPTEAPISALVRQHTVGDFRCYNIIDVHHDSVADFVDFKGDIKPTDTVNVRMQDRICLQFTMKHRDLALLDSVEHALLAYLNSDEGMQGAYRTYMPNLLREQKFNHDQREKLDSLTSQYYFHSSPAASLSSMNNGLVLSGENRVRLFLGSIYAQHARTERMDARVLMATAPVVLENHFAVNTAPVNARHRCLAAGLIIGWLLGCAIAAVIEERKRLIAWLKQ